MRNSSRKYLIKEYRFIYYYNSIFKSKYNSSNEPKTWNERYRLVIDRLTVVDSHLIRGGIYIKFLYEEPLIPSCEPLQAITIKVNGNLTIDSSVLIPHYILCKDKPTEDQIMESYRYRKLFIDL